MGWQNVFAAVFQAGNTVVMNANGMTVYNGTPQAGNLVASISPTNYTDPYGNFVFSGETVYSGFGPGSSNYALQVGPLGIAQYDNPLGQGNNYTERGSILIPQNNPRSSWSVTPGSLILGEEPNPTADIAGLLHVIFQADSNGRPLWFSGGNPVTALWLLDRSQTDVSFITVPGTTVAPANLTKQYAVDPVNGLIPGTTYTLRSKFQGNTALNNQSFFVNLDGTTTLLATVAGNFIPGLVSGQAMFGSIELEILVINANTVRASLSGVIASGNPQSNATACEFSSAALSLTTTGVSIGLATDWAASNAAQTITTIGSRLTRRA